MPLKHHVTADLLQLNKPLPWDVFDGTGQLLLCKGYVISRESQMQVLLAHGLYVDESLIRTTPLPSAARPSAHYDPFRLWEHILDELGILLRTVHIEPEFLTQMNSLARLVQMLAERSPDTALAAMILTEQRRYPIIHSLHTAILCELIARRLGWDEARRTSLCCAAMTMNLAMLELQQQLCSQRRAPTPEQRRDINRHPALGAEMLLNAGVTDEVWLAAVRDHHERRGGGGYPFGITSPSAEAHLIQTCDIFSAKVSPRAARAPITAQEAARALFVQPDGGGQNPYAATLIKEVGIFPPGTCVNLANGETGIVLQRGASANTPLVMSLLNQNGLSYQHPLRRDTSLKLYEITSVVPRDKVRVRFDPEVLWRNA
ncbi:HD domain-containing phosphohydrolase [Uliginosibacterium sp. H3]|uniref:HD domain-containing phosphohydrolase n=1 Tax=Uliginosibacterium silvisoli TaxID=3114758 RepID=A0ABU6K863_9RHOO|nr:HD domain-containing phosphohydrolase [Uliginosibacterium sp. H3]